MTCEVHTRSASLTDVSVSLFVSFAKFPLLLSIQPGNQYVILNMVRVDSKCCFWVTGLDPQAVSTRGNDVLNEPADWVSKLSRTVWAVSMAASGIPGESQYQHLGVKVSTRSYLQGVPLSERGSSY